MNERVVTAVFDTNVVVSGFLSPHGPPGRIVDWLRAGQLRAALDDRIAAEYEDVLLRPVFSLPPHDVRIVLRAIRSHAVWPTIGPSHAVTALPDPDDAPFAECALALGCPLVTGNRRHFPRRAVADLQVQSPRAFAESLAD